MAQETLSTTKVAIIGPENVGKSAIVARWVKNTFLDDYTATIGAGFFAKIIGNRRFEIWETAGQERYRSLTPMYTAGAHVILVVWNAQEYKTFDKLEGYLETNKRHITPDTHVIFIRNKVDTDKDGKPIPALSEDERKKIEGADGYVKEFGIKHYAIMDLSAKNNTGFDEFEKKMLAAPKTTPAPVKKRYVPFEVANSPSPKRSSACCNFFKAPIVQIGSGALIAGAGLATALTSKQLAAWLFLKLLALATVPPAAVTALLVIGIVLTTAGVLLAANGTKNMICRPRYASV